MRKITFIGAGSFGFTRNLVRDILTFPALADCELALMDINPNRLKSIKKAVEQIVEAGKYPAKITATENRAEALKGADGVVITILAAGLKVWRKDVEIPMKYGIDINIGDTRGPSGIFRYLRTAPILMDICRDIEKYCPDAVVLNYTNPMAMLCRTMQSETGVNITGLCHSVQGTAEQIAGWLKADMKDVTFTCAGINHQAWFIDYKIKGKDAYPALREAIKNPDIYKQEIIRNQMFMHLDYYVTESSGHNSEYVAWFRKRPELIEKYCHAGTGWNDGVHGFCVQQYERQENTWEQAIEDSLKETPNIARGHEYASYIFNGVFGDNTIYEFNGNVRNFGLIDNLPEGCCVEVPVTASKVGLRAAHVGPLPDQLALLNNISARCEELAIKSFLAGDKHGVFQAVAFDPLTSAVLSLDEIQQMTDEMFEANKDYLPNFKF